jgi:hypothetical protein
VPAIALVRAAERTITAAIAPVLRIPIVAAGNFPVLLA